MFKWEDRLCNATMIRNGAVVVTSNENREVFIWGPDCVQKGAVAKPDVSLGQGKP